MPSIPPRRLGAPLVALALLAGVTACSSSDASSGSSVAVVSYSVTKPVYEALTVAFQNTDKGSGVTFTTSFGASGEQRDKVLNGLKADYVGFSLEPDLTKLVPDLVADGWQDSATKGLVSDSVVVLGVRPGNPKHITGWDDLVRPGVKIVTPDPRSSGGARWNALAAFNHGARSGGEAAGLAYLNEFFGNAVSKPESAAKATQTFLDGTGDVLVGYENDVIQARQKGQQLDYVIPDDTLLIENPAAVTKSAPQAAKDFLAFVESPEAQPVWTANGFRSVIAGTDPGTVKGATDPTHPYPAVKHLATVAQLGGWSAVNKKFFDKDAGLVTKILDSST